MRPPPAASQCNCRLSSARRKFWSDRSPPDSAKNSHEQLKKRLTGFLTAGESLKPYSNKPRGSFHLEIVITKTRLCCLGEPTACLPLLRAAAREGGLGRAGAAAPVQRYLENSTSSREKLLLRLLPQLPLPRNRHPRSHFWWPVLRTNDDTRPAGRPPVAARCPRSGPRIPGWWTANRVGLRRTVRQPSVVAFWSKEDASARKRAVGLLKRVAARAGAMVISQCATERINKNSKEVWTADRRSAGNRMVLRRFYFWKRGQVP